MTIDMSLISLKDGGRFAMSWIAGTNPKALRSNNQRNRIYSVDITEVCDEMIESIKVKEDKLSFRMLFRLCFGTINIYAEQVTHLYNVTLNFLCFNTFVLKQCSRKRNSSTAVPDNLTNKRMRLESTDDLDISSLLMESEICNNYTEDKFTFPNEVGYRKPSTSTCIQINQITIRHVSWDNPMPEEDDAFGDASQEERSILLSEFSETQNRFRDASNQKRKTSYTPECSPFKRPCLINDSIDDLRFDLSSHNDTMSEAGLDFNQTIDESEKYPKDINENYLNQTDLESTFRDMYCTDPQQYNDQLSTNDFNYYAREDTNEIPMPADITPQHDCISNYTNEVDVENVENNTTVIESPKSSFSLEEIPQNSTLQQTRKRKLPKLIIDTQTKIPKKDLENVWKHCYDISKMDHLASVEKPKKPCVINKQIISSRFQSDKLLIDFNKKLKPRLKQNHDYDRQLILEEILGHEFEEFKTLFKIKRSYSETRTYNNKQRVIENENEIVKELQLVDSNNNIQIEEELNCNQSYVETNTCNQYETQNSTLTLKCSLDEIDPSAISFNFPLEAGKQRSEWGKEGIMKKLLNAWLAEDSVINMKTIIVGANRINAALTFHTLLDLAGLQYIVIEKNENNSIESIKMGPETIRIINESCA